MAKKVLFRIQKQLSSVRERVELFWIKLTLKPASQKRALTFAVLAVLLTVLVLFPSLTYAQNGDASQAPSEPGEKGPYIPWWCKPLAALNALGRAFAGQGLGGSYVIDVYDCAAKATSLKLYIQAVTLEAFKNLILAVLSFISAVLTHLLVFFAAMTASVIEIQNTILAREQVQAVWGTILDIANVVFVVALLIFAVMIILRQTGYNFKKAVTSLIIAITLANTSGLIVTTLNGLANLLAKWASGIFLQQSPGGGEAAQTGATNLASNALATLVRMFSGSMTNYYSDLSKHIYELPNKPENAIQIFNGLTEATFIVFFIGIGVYVVYRLFFLFIERMVRIVLYFAFAPLAFAAGLLPNKQMTDIPSKWWSELIKWLLVYPAALLLMGFALIFLNAAIVAVPGTGENGLIGGVISLITSSTDASGVTTAFEAFAFATIAIVLLLTAANIAKVTGLTATAAVGAAAAWLPGVLKKTTGRTLTAARRVAAAPFQAGAKYAGARAKGWAKNVGFRLATTRPLRPITEWAYKVARKPLLAEEAQAKERELHFKGLDAQQLRVRYVALSTQVNNAEDKVKNQVAQAKFKTNYDKLKPEEKTLVDKRADVILSRNPVVSGHIRNLKTLEGSYMRTLGDAAKVEYDLGKLPAETYKDFIDSAEKYKTSGKKDAEAGFKMQYMFDVLKRQALHLTGKQREVAIGYRDEVASNTKYTDLLKQAGFPKKFGYATFGVGEKIGPEVFAKLAVDTYQVQQAQKEVEKLRSQLSKLGQGHIAPDIEDVSTPKTLQAISDRTVGELLVPDSIKNGIEITASRLTSSDKNKIAKIQQSDQPLAEKTNLITPFLARANIPEPNNVRSNIAQALSAGVAIDDLSRAQTISEILYKDSPTPAESNARPVIQRQLGAVANYQTVQAGQAETQRVITSSIGSHPGYEAVIQKDPIYATKQIPVLKREVLTDLGARGDADSIQKIMEQKTKGSMLKGDLITRIQDIAKRFELPQMESEDATIGQHLEMLNNLEAAGRNFGKRPKRTEEE